jgi:hypothetical protein
MVRIGRDPPCRVTDNRPLRVNVIASIASRAGTSMRGPAMPSEMPISPPPQVLYRGCSARSSTIVRAPAEAAAWAAANPAGPAPTTATSQGSSITPGF